MSEINLKNQNFKSIPESTIPIMFKRILTLNNGNSIALRWELDKTQNLPLKKWENLTWDQYYSKSKQFGSALIQNNFLTKETVSILSFNCHEWLISFMGTIFAGGQSCGLYPTDCASNKRLS